ncbi:MAG: histidine--tRNA ligase [Candidatus Lloydbacteria bacterium]|nr:histidine--tRNA ligase [Candidatus Lloydbacteria bacterium]
MPTSSKKTRIKEPPTSPKGMTDIVGDAYYRYQGFFEKAQEIAVYYGFGPIETPILEKEEVFTSGVGPDTDIVEKEMYSLKTKGGTHMVLRPEGTAAIVRAYMENGFQSLPQPVMLYYYGPFFRHENPQKGRMREFRQFGLEILGTPKSIADAMVIRTTTAILTEMGFKQLRVNVNSLGDKESRNAYMRELISYYRKHAGTICSNCRQRLKNNPLRLLDCKEEKCQPLKTEAPESVNFLTPDSQHHFKEVLEYLESMGVEYNIDSTLVRGIDYYSKTVFEIATADKEVVEAAADTEKEKTADGVCAPVLAPLEKPLTIAAGGRYDYLAKQLGSRRDVPGVGASIGVDRVLAHPQVKALDPKIIKKPKVYFIQLGFEAKLKSLSVLEILRKAKIPLRQALAKDSLIAQLAVAERLAIPYALIFGQKEAVDNTVIVRNMDTRSQETVPMDKLADYVKKIK